MSVIRARMCGPEEAVIGPSEECGAAQSPIDEIMTRRIACRDFCDAPVPRRTIEQILHVARFAPSGANIQPWHVSVLSGAAKANISAALLNAHETCRDEHVSEYKYYASGYLIRT
jgi:nitroreductase